MATFLLSEVTTKSSKLHKKNMRVSVEGGQQVWKQKVKDRARWA